MGRLFYLYGEFGMEGLLWETAEEMNLNLARRVRRIRKRRKISQERLSEMSGVSYGYQ